jgi:uncharacterized small protein (DUF1192 family)
MRIDRVKQAAVIELDRQITDKQTEIERLESETASSLWLADLEEFEDSWKAMSVLRLEEATSIAKSEAPGVKAPRKRKPVASSK